VESGRNIIVWCINLIHDCRLNRGEYYRNRNFPSCANVHVFAVHCLLFLYLDGIHKENVLCVKECFVFPKCESEIRFRIYASSGYHLRNAHAKFVEFFCSKYCRGRGIVYSFPLTFILVLNVGRSKWGLFKNCQKPWNMCALYTHTNIVI
jgi:hypothetical protein